MKNIGLQIALAVLTMIGAYYMMSLTGNFLLVLAIMFCVGIICSTILKKV